MAQRVIAHGGSVYFKYTCAFCGSRQASMTPNTMHNTYECGECQHEQTPSVFGLLVTFVVGKGGPPPWPPDAHAA